jgi:copper chaperone CopZ
MTCAFAVRGALKKYPGVETVDVSLNKGLASVKLKPGNTVLPEQLWEAVKKNGFTPKETHVFMRGEVLQPGGKLQLNVTGTSRTYDLAGAPKWLEPGGKVVTIEGTITPAKNVRTPVPLSS